MKIKYIKVLSILFLMLSVVSCKKFIGIDPPKTEIVLSEAFKEDNSAISAVLGIYIHMLQNRELESGGLTIYSGLSADEFTSFSNDAIQLQFQNNQLVPTNENIAGMWSEAYKNVVYINTCLEGLTSSSTLTPSVKEQLLGECKFSRAFVNFYLVNYFDKVPLVKTSDWRVNTLIAQSSKEVLYASIIEDLKEAKALLKADYPTEGRVRPNKWAATALLSRTYLFTKDYVNAEIESSEVIASGLYTPLPELGKTFLRESTEAIWQLMPTRNIVLTTSDAVTFIGDTPSGGAPNYIFRSTFLDSFEQNDGRKTEWLNQVNFGTNEYFIPFKYKDVGDYMSTAPASEYLIVMRAAEQYLIRSEARAQQNNITGAIEDLNVVRSRAGLLAIEQGSPILNQTNLLLSIEKENRHEFFAEWGHRWLDLKRTGRIGAVLSAEKSTWKSTAVNFPIPQTDLEVNRNLQQNPGY